MIGGYALLSFFGLNLIHISAAILYKFAQKDGRYEFSPASPLVMSEMVKILLSLTLHTTSVWSPNPQKKFLSRFFSGISHSISDIRSHLKPKILGQCCGLALSYALYNQLQFLMFMWADASSVVLIRSSGSFVSALLAFFLLDRVITKSKWLMIALQVCGLILVQYDACKAQTTLIPILYLLLSLHVTLSSFNSIWNESLVKQKSAPPLNVQNLILYTFGSIFNIMAYFMLPASLYGTKSDAGFFTGYSLVTILIIVLNSLIGIVITAVYKYADVIVKTFALACATGTLFIIDFVIFRKTLGMNVLFGIIVVYLSSYMYMTYTAPQSSSSTLPKPLTESTTPSESANAIESTATKVPFFLLCVPDFLLHKKFSKTTKLIFILSVLLISIIIYSNMHHLTIKSKKEVLEAPNVVIPIAEPPKKNQTETPTFYYDYHPTSSSMHFQYDPLVDIVYMPPLINSTKPKIPTNFTSELQLVTRPYDNSNSMDRLRYAMKRQRSFEDTKLRNIAAETGEPMRKDLAVCFMGNMTAMKSTSVRWGLWADLTTLSNDKFAVVTGLPSPLAALVDPVDIKKIEYPDIDLNLFANSANRAVNEYCNFTDLVDTYYLVSECGKIIERYQELHNISYKWIYITEPSVWGIASPYNLLGLQKGVAYFRNQRDDTYVDPTSIIGHGSEIIALTKQLYTDIPKWNATHQTGTFVRATAKKLNLSVQRVPWIPHRPHVGTNCFKTETKLTEGRRVIFKRTNL